MQSPEASAPPPLHPRPGPVALAGGVILLLVWLAASAVWFVMSMMGGLMANDSGAVSSGAHGTLLLGLLLGQILTTLAGILGSTGLFWPARRRRLLVIALVLLLAGISAQVASFQWFAASAAG